MLFSWNYNAIKGIKSSLLWRLNHSNQTAAPCKGGDSVIAVTLAKLAKIIVSTCMLTFLQQKTAVWACSVTMQDVVVFILCKKPTIRWTYTFKLTFHVCLSKLGRHSLGAVLGSMWKYIWCSSTCDCLGRLHSFSTWCSNCRGVNRFVQVCMCKYLDILPSKYNVQQYY